MARLTRLPKEFRCPECNSTSIQTRLKTKERVCRRCGYIGKMEEFEVSKPKK